MGSSDFIRGEVMKFSERQHILFAKERTALAEGWSSF